MSHGVRPASPLVGLLKTLSAALILVLGALPFTVDAQGAKDPFDAMTVQRPAELMTAPGLAFTALDGRQVRLSELRGKVVLLGFFTTT